MPQQKIVVQCVEVGNVDLAGRPEPQAIKMLRAVIRLETAARSQRGKAGNSHKTAGGTSAGPPRSRGTIENA